MNIKGYCLRSINEQRSSGDYYNIVPEGVRFTNPVPVYIEFDEKRYIGDAICDIRKW